MAKKKNKTQKGYSANTILKLFRKHSKPLSVKEIFEKLSPDKTEKQAIRNILTDLVNNGKLISLGHGKAYGLTEKMQLVHGRLEIQKSGVGFVIPEDQRRKDIFIAPNQLNDAWPGDKVVAAVFQKQRGKNPEGRIVRILERKLSRLPIIVFKKVGKNLFWGQPTERSIPINFIVDISPLAFEPQINDILIIQAEEMIDNQFWSAKAEQYLGNEEDASVQESIVKLNHKIPTSFPNKVQEELSMLPEEPADSDFADRRDLSELCFVTIDGAKAKDFDDAIYVNREGKNFRLYVAIADVSHYVAPGSALDLEAKSRSNSYYFPQSVEPMFPQQLSNDLCSLKLDLPRLVMVVEMCFSTTGQPISSDFYTGIIRSHARLTYSQIKRALLENDLAEQECIKSVYPMLKEAYSLAQSLYQKRKQRGSLDFDLPEPDILFNIQNEPVDIRPKVRHFGHQIIEEFMIAANESVAVYLESHELPCLYRIHPEPDQDKLRALFRLLEKTSLASSIPSQTDSQSLQSLLQKVENTDLEFLVNRMLLRSMMQASYSPDNQEHFGLASECYCHFTSPIRRYADLCVHRSLKKALDHSSGGKLGSKKLSKIGVHLSNQERIAMSAERDIIKRLTIIFLQDKIGKVYTGIISSLADFGFWVELIEVMADGLVRLSSLTDDYYQYSAENQSLTGKRTGKIYSLGQKLRVEITNVSLSRQEIDLELVERL